MKLTPKEVGQKIRLIRKEKGLTMEEFGNLIGGAKKSAVGNWERGDNFPNNERLKKIAEIGETTVEYLLTGIEVKDLQGNPIPEGLRLFDYEIIGHFGRKLKDSPVTIIYTFIKISKDEIFFYCGIRSNVVLGNIDFGTQNVNLTVLSDPIENETEFINAAHESKVNFNADPSGNYPFVNFDSYLSAISIRDKNFKIDFLKELRDVLLVIIKQHKEIPANDIDFQGKLHYFRSQTTKTITIKI